jgi:hypothetical protein
MSWNTSFIAINKDFSADMESLQADLCLQLSESVNEVSWEDATSPETLGKSIGIINGWTIICDSMLFMDMEGGEPPLEGRIWTPTIEDGLKSLSKDGLVLGFILSGVSGTYGMTIHQNGESVRCRLLQEGQEIINSGVPSKEENTVFSETKDEEMRPFRLLERHGVTASDLVSTKFRLYEPI